jgi:VCBS repeat-containing protein
LREAAIRDFIMSGNADYVAASSSVSTPPAETLSVTGAPEIARGIGAFVSDSSIIEGDSGATTLVYTLYRTGDLTQPDSLTYQIAGASTVYASGSLTFGAGEVAKSVSLDIAGDRLVEADDEIVLSFQPVAPGALILNSQVVTDLIDDDSAPIAKNDAFTGDEDSLLIGNVLSDNGQGVDTGDGTLQVTALVAPDGTQLALGQTHSFDFGKVTLNADGSFTYDPRGTAFDTLDAGETAQVEFGYVLSDGTNTEIGYVDITVTGVDEARDFNEIIGSNRNDVLRGTRGDDLIAGLGGNDLMWSGKGEDWFVFGDETENGKRETDVIIGFNEKTDAIVLTGDAEISSIRDTRDGVQITFEGDYDTLRLIGPRLDADKITIFHVDDLNFV